MAIKALEEEPKTGYWKPYLKEGLKYQCSNCDSRFVTPWECCPHCKAKMVEPTGKKRMNDTRIKNLTRIL